MEERDRTLLNPLIIFGTRPEAIKLAPVIKALDAHPYTTPLVCVTAQHREQLDQVLALFEITPQIDLNLMQPNQTLPELTSRILTEVTHVLQTENPDVVIVQGDTATTMVSALAAFYQRIPVVHVEAGLRSYNIHHPFPEEVNRKLTATLADYHFPPTKSAQDALLQENIPADKILITGNTVIDALQMIAQSSTVSLSETIGQSVSGKIILVTAHRRENHGRPLVNICDALQQIVTQNRDVTVVYPVHLSPTVRKTVFEKLGDTDRIILIDPLPYDALIKLMSESYLVVTDSGGLQEEAPALGKPVIVLRETTERPEGVGAGVAKLVGTDTDTIVETVNLLLKDDSAEYTIMKSATKNLYGDGEASKRIVEFLVKTYTSTKPLA